MQNGRNVGRDLGEGYAKEGGGRGQLIANSRTAARPGRRTRFGPGRLRLDHQEWVRGHRDGARARPSTRRQAERPLQSTEQTVAGRAADGRAATRGGSPGGRPGRRHAHDRLTEEDGVRLMRSTTRASRCAADLGRAARAGSRAGFEGKEDGGLWLTPAAVAVVGAEGIASDGTSVDARGLGRASLARAAAGSGGRGPGRARGRPCPDPAAARSPPPGVADDRGKQLSV